MLWIFRENAKRNAKEIIMALGDYKAEYNRNAKDFKKSAKQNCQGNAKDSKQNTKEMYLVPAKYILKYIVNTKDSLVGQKAKCKGNIEDPVENVKQMQRKC